MWIISFLLFFGPGALVWKIYDNQDMTTAGEIVRTLLNLLLDCTVLLVLSYLTFYLIYGKTLISFSTTYIEGLDKSIWSVSFVWKYGLMSAVYAVVWAEIKIFIRRIWRSRRGKSDVAAGGGK